MQLDLHIAGPSWSGSIESGGAILHFLIIGRFGVRGQRIGTIGNFSIWLKLVI
jgi:hypothetical protein